MHKRIHFMGIGGSGMSAVAAIAKAHGYEVSGCDVAGPNAYTKPLIQEGINIYDSHDAAHLKNIDILCVTPAIFDLNPNHPEFVEAERKGIMMTWQEFMGGFLMKDKFVIGVAGTHGKSTTTAMIGTLLETAGLNPTVEVGATVLQWGKNYRIGKSKYFVVEADEFNNNFLHYRPNILVITNIEMDHPEYFADFKTYQQSFKRLVGQMPRNGKLILFKDLQKHNWLSRAGLEKIYYRAEKNLKENLKINLKVPGAHNIWNASAALKVAQVLGIEGEKAIRALNNFSGIGRRFEFKGEYNGAKIFDDYAHHSTEIRAVLQAGREKFPKKRIWAVFQPHQVSRLKLMLDDFANSFSLVEKVIVTDIFAGREKDKLDEIHARDLVKKIQSVGRRTSEQKKENFGRRTSEQNIQYIGSLDDVVEYLRKNIDPGDIIINIGAGDVYKISEKLIKSN